MSKIMQQELDKCKDCAEYGSEFCEDCLKEQLEKQQSLQNNLTLKLSNIMNTLQPGAKD